jgi:phosphoglycolate phosphatase
MRKFKAVVFDLDGTLVDSAPDLANALNMLLAERRRRSVSLEEVKSMIGDGATKLVERAFAATCGPESEPGNDSIAALTARFLDHYQGHAADLTRPYPGVREALERLKSDGLALAICSNKPFLATREVLRDLDLDGYFAAVVGGDSIPGVRKPDPRMLLAVLEALQIPPTAAVMVGDNANDVMVARGLDVAVILRADGYTLTPAADLGADAIFGHFSELPEVLDRLR